jgi:ABC-type multidrug transport system fused ATPase/permease subunit
MLIVAHRLTTLKHCNILVELADGKIKKIGTYDEVVNNGQHKVG